MVYFFILLNVFQQASFKETQLQNARVKSAYSEKEAQVRKYFSNANLKQEGFHLFLRGFKNEKKLEAWVKPKGSDTYSLLHSYDFCSSSGVPGPKRKEGDLQIPEGIYHINHFNPASNFHLSLGINYPNSSDLILSDKKAPGSAIYIHGNCVTIGCIPITDDKIKELYILAVEARNNGQEKIPVHIYPTRLDDQRLSSLLKSYGNTHQSFWENLKPIYADFESSRRLKAVTVDSKGLYHLKQ